MTSTKRRTLRFAIVSGLAVLVLACVAVNAFRSSQRNLHLMDAVDRGDKAQVRALLAQGANPNSHNSPVHLNWRDVDRLICCGRRPGRQEATVLMQAAYNGNDQMLQALLKAGGDVHDETSYGRTPLIFAVDEANDSDCEQGDFRSPHPDIFAAASLQQSRTIIFFPPGNFLSTSVVYVYISRRHGRAKPCPARPLPGSGEAERAGLHHDGAKGSKRHDPATAPGQSS